jgi:hypothetical protein
VVVVDIVGRGARSVDRPGIAGPAAGEVPLAGEGGVGDRRDRDGLGQLPAERVVGEGPGLIAQLKKSGDRPPAVRPSSLVPIQKLYRPVSALEI